MTTRIITGILLLAVAGGLRSNLPAQEASGLRWFKGNLHTHSLWSDGNDYPEMICDWYAQHGYHFLALSDHNILSRGEKWIAADLAEKRGGMQSLERYQARFGESWVQTREVEGRREVRLRTLAEFRGQFERPGAFLLIESEEITDRFRSLPIHINAAHLDELIRPQGGDSVRDTIGRNLRAVEQQGRRLRRPIFAHLNHPNFEYAVTAEDLAHVPEERFFEVFNGHPGVHHQGDDQHAAVERLWDIANTLRIATLELPPLLGLATDDSHNYFGRHGASPGRGWVMVRAADLTPESLIAALHAGDFYASSGVTLNEVRFDAASRTLDVQVAAEEGVTYVTEFLGTKAGFDPQSQPVTDAAGQELPVTRRYSPDIGRVLARVEGPHAHYTLTGDELYVRAVVTSSRTHPNPAVADQPEQAWTQPVGWQRPR